MIAETLSRNPILYVLSSITIEWRKIVVEKYDGDEFAEGIFNWMMRSRGYVIKDKIILKRNKVFLTHRSEVKGKVLHALHNNPLINYPRFTKTY